MIVFRDACAHEELIAQQVKSSEPCCAPLRRRNTSTMCYLQAGQLWALQSHVDRSRNDAAIYKRRCQQHVEDLQASGRTLLELQQNLELAKSQMTSLQSSSMEADNETRRLKLSNFRVDKKLQASKVASTRSSYCADLYCCNVSQCPAQLAHTAHHRTLFHSDVFM